MIRTKVHFTELDIDPDAIADRWHRGVIPLHWHRHRFTISRNVENPLNLLSRWMFNNLEGKWAMWSRHAKSDVIEIHLAFENDFDGVTFVLADGKTKALREGS